eukprot:6195365-Pleurochrysis_carterae.AAC.1
MATACRERGVFFCPSSPLQIQPSSRVRSTPNPTPRSTSTQACTLAAAGGRAPCLHQEPLRADWRP